MAWFLKSSKKQPGFILSFCYQIMKAGNIPQHVAFIMDGNRRFARKENMTRKEGHSKGFEKLTDVLQWCFQLGIPEVTVYAFSIDNFKRPPEEVDALMSIFKEKIERLLQEEEAIMEHGVCIRFIGDVTLFNDDIQKAIAKVVNLTKNNDKSFFNIAMAYTSRNEITQAIKEVALGVNEGFLRESDINEELLENCFYTNKSKPIDLLIRTSGEVRLSDFLLWQTSFSILCFIDVLWPELTVWNFFYCVLRFQLGYNNMENAKELSKLKEIRTQMDNDLKDSFCELKSTSSSEVEEKMDVTVKKYTQQRKERTEKFLQNLENKRSKLLSRHLEVS